MVPTLGRDLCEPNNGLGSLELAKEQRPLAGLVAPMHYKACSFMSDASWHCGRSPPSVDIRPNFVHRVVSSSRRCSLDVAKNQFLLVAHLPFGSSDWHDVFRAPTIFDDCSRRTSSVVERPVTGRTDEGTVQNRVVEIHHEKSPLRIN